MGKIGKPQKRKKNKIKKYGWYKNNDTVNRAPKDFHQEVPRRLKELGMAIKEAQSKKRNRNKFKNKPDGPNPNSTDCRLTITKGSKYDLKSKKVVVSKEDWGKKKIGKKMLKLTQEATEKYIDDLKPTRPLLENFKFKQKANETDKQFLKRVERETNHTITKSKIADKFDMSEKDKIKSMVKAKLVAEKREKKKEKLKEMLEPQANNEKEKKKEFMDFSSLQDDEVPFGEVVHAPPALSVLPKYATAHGHDRPGVRMPELKDAFSSREPVRRNKGETVKRKNLTIQQQFESDTKREQFVEAYRQMKKKRKFK